MNKFKETPRMYQADEVDSEIAILIQSKNFWKKKAEEYRDELDKSSNPSDNSRTIQSALQADSKVPPTKMEIKQINNMVVGCKKALEKNLRLLLEEVDRYEIKPQTEGNITSSGESNRQNIKTEILNLMKKVNDVDFNYLWYLFKYVGDKKAQKSTKPSKRKGA